MLKLTHILKEDYLPKLLDNPTNRRLLNIIAKNNDLSTISIIINLIPFYVKCDLLKDLLKILYLLLTQ